MRLTRATAAAACLVTIVAITPLAPAHAGLFGPPKMPDPATLAVPDPIAGNTGKYMCPFTSDGVTADWVTKSMKVGASGQLGSVAGQLAGQEAMKQVPFVGGMLGSMAGKQIGRSIALKAIGGEQYLKNSSDLSFNNTRDMSIYIYAKYSSKSDYPKILEATYAIYPEIKDVYLTAVLKAPHRPQDAMAAEAPAAPAKTEVTSTNQK